MAKKSLPWKYSEGRNSAGAEDAGQDGGCICQLSTNARGSCGKPRIMLGTLSDSPGSCFMEGFDALLEWALAPPPRWSERAPINTIV